MESILQTAYDNPDDKPANCRVLQDTTCREGLDIWLIFAERAETMERCRYPRSV